MGAEKKQKAAAGAQDKNIEQKKKSKEKEGGVQRDEVHTCCGCRFPLLVAMLQLILGVSIAVVAFIMAAGCSSLLVRDTPHWAGISVSVVAILGLLLLCVPYQPDEKTSGQFTLKLLYFLLSAISCIICVLVVAFASYHYTNMTHYSCKMEADMCQCTLEPSDPLSRMFIYQSVADCDVVTTTIKLFTLLQIVLNMLLALVCLAACFIMWNHRYQVFYAGNWFHAETPQQKV
ncbi:sarcospan [Gastrophryne carolinensis]